LIAGPVFSIDCIKTTDFESLEYSSLPEREHFPYFHAKIQKTVVEEAKCLVKPFG
jgi:hypothetical protein